MLAFMQDLQVFVLQQVDRRFGAGTGDRAGSALRAAREMQ